MARKWIDIYEPAVTEKGITKYVAFKKKEKEPLLRLIRKYAPNKTIFEFGSGSAATIIALSLEGYSCIGIDSERQMRTLAMSNAQQSNAKLKIVDSFKALELLGYKTRKKADVCFSSGVLEHYSDNEIRELVKEQLKYANTVIISIPTNYFGDSQRLYGDERFVSPKYWQDKILSPFKIIERSHYFHLDSLKSRCLKLMLALTFGKVPTKKPFEIFVVRA